MHSIHVTENKSTSIPVSQLGMVRVFIDQDYHYGYFVSEKDLWLQLDDNQKEAYMKVSWDAKFQITTAQAEWIKKYGVTY